jgi:hypothetical protein
MTPSACASVATQWGLAWPLPAPDARTGVDMASTRAPKKGMLWH